MRKVRAPQGKNNGQRPPKATLGKVQQRNTASLLVRVERRGKSSPVTWEHRDAVNSIRSNTAMGADANQG